MFPLLQTIFLLISVSILLFESSQYAQALSPAPAKGFGTPKTPPLRYTVDTSCKPLIDHLQRSKADLKAVTVGTSDKTGRRGLFATKNIKADKIICKIPSDLALALSDPANGGLDCPTMAHNGASYLHNFCEKSNWDFYTTSLPPTTTTPDMYSDEEIALLEWPWLLEAIKERKEAISTVANEKGLDESVLQRAAALVSSRSFRITVADEEDDRGGKDDSVPSMMDDRGQVITKAGQQRNSIRVLLPLLDMANHSGNKANARLTIIDPHKDEAWFALTATRNIQKGQEICLFYGDTSDALLLNYGFVDDAGGNSMDKYMLKKNPFSDWTTSLEEDQTMLEMIDSDDDDNGNLESILKLRIQLKQSQLEN